MRVVALAILGVQAMWVDELLQREALPVVMHRANVQLVRRQHHGIVAMRVRLALVDHLEIAVL